MSFVDKFKIALEDGKIWDETVGHPMLQRIGCCGKNIKSKKQTNKKTGKKTWEDRLDKIRSIPGQLSQENEQFLIELESSGFQDKICIKEKGHKGKCSHQPYLPKETKFKKNLDEEDRDPLLVAINGIRAKIKDPENNPGGQPCPLQNRGGSRNNLTMFDKDTEKHIRNVAKKKKREKYYTNLAIRLSMGATPAMIATATLDMIAMIYHSKDCAQYLPVTERFKQILDQRWAELKELYLNCEPPMIIFDRNDHLMSPVSNRTLELLDYGKGHTELNGIQFGHILPIREDKWMTRGGNVIPLPRGDNLKQSNSNLQDVPLDQLKHSVEQVKRLKELGRLSPDYQKVLDSLK
jgi:hypothetical protein